jgi:spore coat polysaccharide biosynthesis protein SpsF
MVKNIYVIIQARMNSERLPGKVMKPIRGVPMIGIMIKRLKNAGYPVILATSVNPENDILSQYAKDQGIGIYRGSENNVLERFWFAAKENGADYIVRVTGDNPLVDGLFIRTTIESIQDFGQNTFFTTTKSKTFPIGTGFEYFSFCLLEKAYKNSDLTYFKEHVTPYMHQNVPGDIKILTISRDTSKLHYRLTVDTIEDFTLIKTLIEKYNADNLTIDQIISVLDSNPDLTKINMCIKQKKWWGE